ncbi:MAG: SDR family oxidoreductase [Myxococcota bacterium]|nr:SDR family oxidoreductase [Myxococcota bacterium]
MTESAFRPDSAKDRVVLVTGGGTGIGHDIARCFGEHGAKLAICSRKRDVIDGTTQELIAEGHDCLGLTCDVRDPIQVEAVMEAVVERYGRLDVVVNNAAGNFPAPMTSISPKGFKTVVDIDLLGTYNVSKAAYDAWFGEHGGAIVNISAPFERMGAAFQAHVAAAKMGVDSLTRSCAIEWGPKGIRVNGVAPGPIEGTEGMSRFAELMSGDEKAPTPLGRMGTKRDIANAVLFLCSDAASFITGQVFAVCGGTSVDALKMDLPS